MGLFKIVAIAATLASAPAVALAADPLAVRISTNEAAPVANTGVDWNGFYAGVYGVTQSSPVGGLQYGLGLDLGVNAQFEFVLVGAEIAYHGLTGGAGSTAYVQTIGKAGVAIAGDLVIYGAGGFGIALGAPAETDALIGAGAEFAIAENLSLKGQYLHGFALTGANPKDQVTVGANFHF
ncbi:MAG: porin family protein [Devosia sp.]